MRRGVMFGLMLTFAAAAAAQAPVLPDLADTEIEMSWQDFKLLVEAAQPVVQPTPAPPRSAFIRSAE